jgi:hypothetical protein
MKSKSLYTRINFSVLIHMGISFVIIAKKYFHNIPGNQWLPQHLTQTHTYTHTHPAAFNVLFPYFLISLTSLTNRLGEVPFCKAAASFRNDLLYSFKASNG